MKMYPMEFPRGRRKKPKRQAESRVYEALAGASLQGFVYYEWRKNYGCIELDFAVWVEELGRFALQVKGGRYLLVDGEWHLKKRDGFERVKSCPLDETKLAALDLHDDIAELATTTYNPFVVPVLVFPDMEPDEPIKNLAKRKGVYLVWGTNHLMKDLASIARSRGVYQLLTASQIDDEVLAVTDGLIRLGHAGDVAAVGEDESANGLAGRSTKGVLRLTLDGKTVVSIRSNTVRCHSGKSIFVGEEAKR